MSMRIIKENAGTGIASLIGQNLLRPAVIVAAIALGSASAYGFYAWVRMEVETQRQLQEIRRTEPYQALERKAELLDADTVKGREGLMTIRRQEEEYLYGQAEAWGIESRWGVSHKIYSASWLAFAAAALLAANAKRRS